MSRNKNNIFNLKLNHFIKENSFLNNNNKEKNSNKKINIININKNQKDFFNLNNFSSQKFNNHLKIIHLRNKNKLNYSNNSNNLLNLSNYSHDLNIKRTEGELLLTSLNLNNYKNLNDINDYNYLSNNFYTIDNRKNYYLNIKENKKIFYSKNKSNKLPKIFSDIKTDLKELNKKKYLLKNLINLDDKNEINNFNNKISNLKIQFSPIKIKSKFQFNKKFRLKPLKNNNLNKKKLLNILELQKKKNYVLDYLNEQNIKDIKTERKRLNKIKKNYDKIFNHMKNITINQLDNYMYSDDVLL